MPKPFLLQFETRPDTSVKNHNHVRTMTFTRETSDEQKELISKYAGTMTVTETRECRDSDYADEDWIC